MTNNKMIFIANWKMYGDKNNLKGLKEVLKFERKKIDKKNTIIYCPPYTLLSDVSKILKNSNIKVGAQNCHHSYEYGPNTGCINVKLLKNVGAEYVIIGHSENRFYDNDNIINKKLLAATKENLKIIFCLGETLKEKKSNKTFKVLKNQIRIGLKKIKNINNVIIAYEPRWSIGTGNLPKKSELINNTNFIKKIIRSIDKKGRIKIIYGGSVNPSNISELCKIKLFNGFLIGSASLKHNNFIDIIKKTTI